MTGLPPVTWLDHPSVERLIRGQEPAILHLHGHWRHSESVVLGTHSYCDILADAFAQAIQTALSLTTTLVFVGFGAGLDDPNFSALLAWNAQNRRTSTYPSYWLVRSDELAPLQGEHPIDERLQIIPYGAKHEDLPSFIRSLGSARTPPAVLAPAPPPDPPPPPARLPICPRSFGRDAEIEALVQALLADKPLPIPILGTAGIGKSNLTLQALHDERVRAKYGDPPPLRAL